MYKTAGWWEDVKAKLQGWVGRREVDARAEKHFKAENPDWGKFDNHLSSSKFRKAVMQDPRADNKLKRFVKTQDAIMTHDGPSMKVMSSKGEGSYEVQYDPSTKKYRCTCPDFKYKQFNKPNGACKHIQRVKQEGGIKKSEAEMDEQEYLNRQFASSMFTEMQKLALEDDSWRTTALRTIDVARPYAYRGLMGAIPGAMLGGAVGAAEGSQKLRAARIGALLGAGVGLADKYLERKSQEDRKLRQVLTSYKEKLSAYTGDVTQTHTGGAKPPSERSKQVADQLLRASKSVGKFHNTSTTRSIGVPSPKLDELG